MTPRDRAVDHVLARDIFSFIGAATLVRAINDVGSFECGLLTNVPT
jgi:hypothetical protein